MLKLATHPLAQRVAQWPSHPAAVYSRLQLSSSGLQQSAVQVWWKRRNARGLVLSCNGCGACN